MSPPMRSPRVPYRSVERRPVRNHPPPVGCAVVLTALLLAAPVRAADPPDTGATRLPAWAVLVLQPVGDKRVRPVTGAVVSGDGTVIVPADFAKSGDVLIVLDGGSDIIENGRTATVRASDTQAGIAVLDVRGLVRVPAVFSEDRPVADAVVRLAAFPPAEQIAEGAAPLWAAARAEQLPTAPAGAPGPLPNVSGPLLDRCGNLAGFSLAAGVPAMQPAEGTVYVWSAELRAALQRVGVTVGQGRCDAAAAGTRPEPDGAVAPVAEETTDAADREPASSASRAAEPSPTAAIARPDRGGWPLWAWVTACLGAVAAVSAIAWRLRRRARPPGLLQDAAVYRTARRSADDGPARGEPGGAGPGWQLEIRGQLPGGAGFRRRCPVNPAAIDVVIGSGAADIRIDVPGIAREHVRLGGSAGALTLADLGAGGTWINRVPCSLGEVMFLADGDTVVLGETGFRVELVPPGGEAPPEDERRA